MTPTIESVQRIIAAHEARKRAEICEQLGIIVPRLEPIGRATIGPSLVGAPLTVPDHGHHRAILNLPAHKKANHG